MSDDSQPLTGQAQKEAVRRHAIDILEAMSALFNDIALFLRQNVGAPPIKGLAHVLKEYNIQNPTMQKIITEMFFQIITEFRFGPFIRRDK